MSGKIFRQMWRIVSQVSWTVARLTGLSCSCPVLRAAGGHHGRVVGRDSAAQNPALRVDRPTLGQNRQRLLRAGGPGASRSVLTRCQHWDELLRLIGLFAGVTVGGAFLNAALKYYSALLVVQVRQRLTKRVHEIYMQVSCSAGLAEPGGAQPRPQPSLTVSVVVTTARSHDLLQG